MSQPAISVIIPSALRCIPGTSDLWLKRAIASITAQTVRPREILIGLDPGIEPPAVIPSVTPNLIPIRIVHGQRKRHQATSNAAGQRAEGALIAFLEDDDEWLPNHLEILLRVMDYTDASFVSTSQVEVNLDGTSRGKIFDFPTASTWLMTRLLWLQMDGFDERWQISHDNEFLARLNEASVPRAHVIEATADPAARPQLVNLAAHARLVRVGALEEPTVRRTIHTESIMADAKTNGERAERLALEYAALEVLYGSLEATW